MRIRKEKVVYGLCECGHLIEPYIVKSIHNFITSCPKCQNILIKRSVLLNSMNSNDFAWWKYCIGEFETFAIAWAGYELEE